MENFININAGQNASEDNMPITTIVEIDGTTYEINSYFNHAITYIDLIKNRIKREMEVD